MVKISLIPTSMRRPGAVSGGQASRAAPYAS